MYGILDISTINADTGSDSLLLCTFVAPTKVTSKSIIKGSDTLSLRRIRYRTSAQRWEIETDSAILNRSTDLFVHQIENDSINAIFVRPPLPVKNNSVALGHSRPAAGDDTVYPIATQGLAESNGTATAGAGFSAGAVSVSIILDINSEIYKSDFIRFNGHDKVYMVTDIQAITPAAHTSTLSIFPPLSADILGTEVIYLGKRATMKMTYDLGSVLGISYIDGVLANPGILTLIEDL